MKYLIKYNSCWMKIKSMLSSPNAPIHSCYLTNSPPISKTNQFYLRFLLCCLDRNPWTIHSSPSQNPVSYFTEKITTLALQGCFGDSLSRSTPTEAHSMLLACSFSLSWRCLHQVPTSDLLNQAVMWYERNDWSLSCLLQEMLT